MIQISENALHTFSFKSKDYLFRTTDDSLLLQQVKLYL